MELNIYTLKRADKIPRSRRSRCLNRSEKPDVMMYIISIIQCVFPTYYTVVKIKVLAVFKS